MQLNQLINYFIVIAFIFLLITGWKTYHQTIQYKAISQQLAQQSTLNNRLIDSVKELFGGTDKIQQLHHARESHQQSLTIHTLIFFILTLFIGILAWVKYRQQETFYFILLCIAFIAFFVGIFTPAMALTASKPITGLGNIIAYHQTKGIYSTIEGLITHQNFIVGIPLAIFSLIIPLIKNIAMLAVLTHRHPFSQKAMDVIHKLSKWSMADVFVISLLLAFFATEKDQLMQAELLPGIYFFGLYALLSISLSHHIHQLDH